ncbi:hypothetical protein BO82DRAFT_401474 [Aspergillus uvarum CBS 121591]|uniref:Uncharacterized protein n=1 Tax=Aspergillus uvarum CBS 121591 TaxID=1448315 RepID=A0A319CGQ0_9EURO|nr:hypothetical protein BO82DRAFT_401474 [Aspergillus uvarum CBS 121591]PYH82487.1 hypothetical protein BO82DRAFT_401474 [Aspergillus uvarum CBS 121591]
MSGQVENIPLHTREPGDEITEADLAKLLAASDPLTSAAVATAVTQGTSTITFNLEDLFVEYTYDDEDEDGFGDEDGDDEEGEEDDDGMDEVYYNEATDGWLGLGGRVSRM